MAQKDKLKIFLLIVTSDQVEAADLLKRFQEELVTASGTGS